MALDQLCSKSGAIDLFLQKKGAFYQNVSHWTDEPMAHIVPHWNLKGLEGEEVVVTVYTNCEELELYLNGVSLGKQEIEKYGIEPFIKKCKESVWQYTNEWKVMSDRVGYWCDMDDPYVTYHDDYIESV